MNQAQFLAQVSASQGIIYKLVGVYANDSEEKKDLYQEILLQAWKALPSIKQEAKFSTWLYRICLNTIFTYQRKHHRVQYKESLEHIAPTVQNSGLQKEDTVRLQQAIRQLQETDRALVCMHLDGYENEEIAQVTGLSKNNATVRLHRAKQAVVQRLKTWTTSKI